MMYRYNGLSFKGLKVALTYIIKALLLIVKYKPYIKNIWILFT